MADRQNQHHIVVTGKVNSGQKIGRTIGFPTANIDTLPNKQTIKTGVYFGTCQILAPQTQPNQTIQKTSFPLKYHCLAYFGPRYIFEEKTDVFEVYLYNFKGILYGYTIETTLLKYIRPPYKTNSIKQLQTQLENDKKQGQKLIKQGLNKKNQS